jgi:hypothetical protein
MSKQFKKKWADIKKKEVKKENPLTSIHEDIITEMRMHGIDEMDARNLLATIIQRLSN